MNLTELLIPWSNQNICDCDIIDIQNNSRAIKPGNLFIAYPGAASDGRLFIEQAVAAGAVAVVYEAEHIPSRCILPDNIPCIPIFQLQQKVAAIAQRFYQNPSQSLVVSGVTGTNGKTTIAYQLAQAHTLLKQKSAYLGTIGQGNVARLEPLENTTPDALCLQKLLAHYLKEEVRHVCIEVSSHALSQHRVDGIEFKQAIFTNLTLDHLDYHHTMEEYAAAKALLFANPYLEVVIVNHDDEYHELMFTAVQSDIKKISYGLKAGSDVQAISWHSDINGTIMVVRSPWGMHQIKIKALGQFNISNSLAVFTSLMLHGYAVSQVIEVMTQLHAAPGRMEVLAKTPYVLVDYAHTPDALKNVLMTLHELKKEQLWVVFGCGGNRDTSKRPLMGAAASMYADHIIVTSDNPRNEEPEQIIADIKQGIVALDKVITIAQREEAIAYALAHAHKEDIILIAGKGHESYQQIGAIKHPFSDQEVVGRFLTERGLEPVAEKTRATHT